MPSADQKREAHVPQLEVKWTPRAIKVLATARAIAEPAKIKAEHLLLAIEAVALVTGDHPASRVLARLGIEPSTALGKPVPESCPRKSYASWDRFDDSLSTVFPAMPVEEAQKIDNDYVGTEHLLLFLARVGVQGVSLPYEQIRNTVVELQEQS